MNSIATVWNPDENFWVLNPTFKTIRLFRQLFDKDKSKGKAQSSKLMWAIALCRDKNESNVWRNMADTEKEELIASDYLKDKDFKWDHPEIVEYCDTYERFCLTTAERELQQFEKKLVERGRFIFNTPFTLDYFDDVTGKMKKGTADQLDRMMVNTSKIFDQLDEIKSKIEKESAEGHLRGGAEESLSETGLI